MEVNFQKGLLSCPARLLAVPFFIYRPNSYSVYNLLNIFRYCTEYIHLGPFSLMLSLIIQGKLCVSVGL